MHGDRLDRKNRISNPDIPWAAFLTRVTGGTCPGGLYHARTSLPTRSPLTTLLMLRLVYLPDGQLPLHVPHWIHGSMLRLASFSVFDISDGFILFTETGDPGTPAQFSITESIHYLSDIPLNNSWHLPRHIVPAAPDADRIAGVIGVIGVDES